MAELFTIGVDCFIDARGQRDADGDPLDCTGFLVTAVARAYYEHGEILTRWSTSPGVGEGTAIAGGAVIDRVRLVVTPELSSAWDALFVVVQAEMVSLTGQRSRPINKVYQTRQEAVLT